jgi:hypothetical protein
MARVIRGPQELLFEVCTGVCNTCALATLQAHLTRLAKRSKLNHAESDGRYWARTSDPQLVDMGQACASVRARSLNRGSMRVARCSVRSERTRTNESSGHCGHGAGIGSRIWARRVVRRLDERQATTPFEQGWRFAATFLAHAPSTPSPRARSAPRRIAVEPSARSWRAVVSRSSSSSACRHFHRIVTVVVEGDLYAVDAPLPRPSRSL